MKLYEIDPYLLSARGTKGVLLSIMVATMFNDVESVLKNPNYGVNFDKKKQLLDTFQTVFEACRYISCHDLSESKEYYGGEALEEIARGANAVNIPSSFKRLLRETSEFVMCGNKFAFKFDTTGEKYTGETREMIDYLVRSILKECNVRLISGNSEITIELEV
jgi:hypothetical protein